LWERDNGRKRDKERKCWGVIMEKTWRLNTLQNGE
jgi:hypothetical protein